MALHSRDAVTVSAAVAMRSCADCSSMEGHIRQGTALVRERASLMLGFYDTNLSGKKISDIFNEVAQGRKYV